MSGIGTLDLKVAIIDGDYYAMQAINGYLAWDRRTRVTFMGTDLEALAFYLQTLVPAEYPDVLILDVDHFDSNAQTHEKLTELRHKMPDALLICMAQRISFDLLDVVAASGARAFLLKQDVKMQIAWAIVYAMEQDFLITASLVQAARGQHQDVVYRAAVLPEQREYPEMTDRIRQAIRLCVIEGMPAHLAADEMGISLNTIRGYVKEGYRILEAYDHEEYPTDMTPQERAFMRFTALDEDDAD